MRPCEKHQHSTPARAKRCAEVEAGKRADRKIREVVTKRGGERVRYYQVRHWPPEADKRGIVEVVWFFSGREASRSGWSI